MGPLAVHGINAELPPLSNTGVHEMSETPAIIIDEVLGWKPSNDKQHVILGLKQAFGGELPIALTHDVLANTIVLMIEAMGAFAVPKMQSTEWLVIKPSWFDVWPGEDGLDNFYISFRTANGGELSFLMDRQSTERFSETIQSALGRDTTPPGPRPSRN